jgi:cytochrome b561
MISPNLLTRLAAPRDAGRYDGLTMIFHWTTVVLVVALFALAETWDFVPHGEPRAVYQNLHVSLGILLAAVLVLRLIWRLSGGRRLPDLPAGIMGLLAKIMHVALYVLLMAQVTLGFLLRWYQGETFSFFGLFTIPPIVAPDRVADNIYQNRHNIVAWTIIVLAGGHALIALLHHYLLRDGILRRMLPTRSR